MIEIRDRGPGLPAEMPHPPVKGFFSTKEGGAGIGLLLANATLERLGGQVTLSHDVQGGTCTRIDLPARLAAA